jgi:uncharacterized protein
MAMIKKILLFPLLVIIKLYQWIVSPLMGGQCRFTPTCSAYTTEALKKYGLPKGIWLSMQRMARCHPWGGKGYDPLP